MPFDRLRANGLFPLTLISPSKGERIGANPPCPIPERVRDKYRKGAIKDMVGADAPTYPLKDLLCDSFPEEGS